MSSRPKGRRNRNKGGGRARKGGGNLASGQKQEVARIAKRTFERNVEHKYFYEGSQITTSNAYAFTSLSAIPQAVSDSDRAGDRLDIFGPMQLEYTIRRNTTATVLTETVRVVLFQWFPMDSANPNGTPPTAGLMFLSDPSAGGITYRSQYSHDLGPTGAAPSFRVFYDRTHILVGIATVMTDRYAVNVRKLINTSSLRKRLQYVSGATTGVNMLYLAVITDQAALPAVINFTLQVNFTDA